MAPEVSFAPYRNILLFIIEKNVNIQSKHSNILRETILWFSLLSKYQNGSFCYTDVFTNVHAYVSHNWVVRQFQFCF